MEDTKTMIYDLTEGSVKKKLLQFATPLLLSNMLQAIYNLVDMVVVGRVLGGVGMSAVSIGGDVLHFLTFIAIGFGNAGQILIARFVGQKRPDDIRKMIGTMFTLLLAASLVISVACIAFQNGILNLLNTPAESYADALSYTVTCACGLFFIYGYNIVSAILRGMGDSKRPFVFIGIAAVLNTVLDITFVAYLDLGVFGAALATVIGQGVSFLFSLVYLFRHRDSFNFDFKPASFRVDRDCCSLLIKLGIPMAIQSAAVMLSKMVLTAWINSYGVIYSAIAGIYNKLGTVSGVVSQAFTTAGGSMMSQTLGAKKYRRVGGIMLWAGIYSLVLAGVLCAVLLLWPDATFALFTSDAAVLAAAGIIIWPCIFNFIGGAMRAVGFAMINGAGQPKLNLAIALIDGIVMRIGFTALLGFALGFGCQGFWLGDAFAGYMPFMIGMIYFLGGRYKLREPSGEKV